MTDNHRILRWMLPANAAEILSERHVQTPMKRILDAPMPADSLRKHGFILKRDNKITHNLFCGQIIRPCLYTAMSGIFR